MPMNNDTKDPERTDAPATETNRDRMVRVAMELMKAGVSGQQARRLLGRHDLDRIEQQLRWIDFRNPRKKASLLVAAIENDFEEPANAGRDA